jgi:gamma-glutamylaminecyclotransferase
MPKVFVYGTLKQGYTNNHMLAESKLVSKGVTVALCRLYHAGFPVLRPRSKKASAFNLPVTGEVYDVTDPAVMQALDRLESEGSMYHRRIKLIKLASGKVVKAHTYVGDGIRWQHLKADRLHEPKINKDLSVHYVWPAKSLGQVAREKAMTPVERRAADGAY